MNTVNLTGRLTKEVELRYTNGNGTAVATFTLAVERRFKNEQGEKEADFIQCQCWKKTAEVAANYLKKGSKIGVVGEWRTRNYEGQDGKRIYVNECLINELEFLDTKPSNDNNDQSNTNTNDSGYNSGNRQQNDNNGYQSKTTNNSYSRTEDDPFANDGKTVDISDDDLPF